jgi:hypothetical protein
MRLRLPHNFGFMQALTLAKNARHLCDVRRCVVACLNSISRRVVGCYIAQPDRLSGLNFERFTITDFKKI